MIHILCRRRNSESEAQRETLNIISSIIITHLLNELGGRELLRYLRVYLLLLVLLGLGLLDLHLLDPRDVPGHLQLGYQIGLLGQVGLALQALQAHAPGGSREGLGGHHLIRPPQLNRVQVLDADRRQGLVLFLALDGLFLFEGDAQGIAVEELRQRRWGRSRYDRLLLDLQLVGRCVLALGEAPDGADGGALIADAPQVFRRLDEVVRIGAARERGRNERQYPLLVHQVGSVPLGVFAVETDYGQVGAGRVEASGRWKKWEDLICSPLTSCHLNW